MSQGKAEEVMQRILGELIIYAKTHFAAEEKLMESKAFPGFAAHVAQHRKFVERVGKFQSEFSERKAALSISLLNYLRDWLTSHIMQSDQKYGEFFALKTKSAAHG